MSLNKASTKRSKASTTDKERNDITKKMEELNLSSKSTKDDKEEESSKKTISGEKPKKKSKGKSKGKMDVCQKITNGAINGQNKSISDEKQLEDKEEIKNDQVKNIKSAASGKEDAKNNKVNDINEKHKNKSEKEDESDKTIDQDASGDLKKSISESGIKKASNDEIANDTNEEENDSCSQEDADSIPQDLNTVYVSNIVFGVKVRDLSAKFTCVGDVTHVKLLTYKGRHNGNALVTFKERSMAKDAINSLNRQIFMGRKLIVEDREAMHKNPMNANADKDKCICITSQRQHSPTFFVTKPVAQYDTYGLSMQFLEALNIDLPLVSSVFVAKLDLSVDAPMVREVFSICGRVVNIDIFGGRNQKKETLCAIVEFEHPLEAVQAISMLNNQWYKGYRLHVRMDRMGYRSAISRRKMPDGLKDIGMGLGVKGSALTDFPTEPNFNTQTSNHMGYMNIPSMFCMDGAMGGAGSNLMGYSSPGQWGENYHTEKLDNYNVICVSNLPPDYSPVNLQEICSLYGDVLHVEMRSPGTGLVKFLHSVDANRAVARFNQQPLEGRIISACLL